MTRRGVVVAINSDSPETARRLNQEAAKSIMYADLSPEEALQLVTINPAKILGIDHRTGSITVGKDADFVVWTDNPLSIYAKPEQTWIEGRCFFSLAADSLIREEIRQEKHALIQKALAKSQADGGNRDSRSGRHGKPYRSPGDISENDVVHKTGGDL
jgi:hypothetical protein